MLIALFPNEKKQHSFELARQIRDFFTSHHIQVCAEDEKAHQIGVTPLSKVNLKSVSFLIAMGGDGTLLRIAHQYASLNAPILGINLGHLGFMADIPIEDIFPSLTDLIHQRYTIEERIILECKAQGTSSLYAVNDIVIHRGHNYSLIELGVYVDGIYVNRFVADGIIISTPTGSTAYSLAAGGPILSPDLKAIMITPICPHTISNRPIVLTAERTIEVEYLSPYDPIDVRADGLTSLTIKTRDKVQIQSSQRRFQLVNLYRHEYFTTLRSKLGWSGKLKSSEINHERFHP